MKFSLVLNLIFTFDSLTYPKFDMSENLCENIIVSTSDNKDLILNEII